MPVMPRFPSGSGVALGVIAALALLGCDEPESFNCPHVDHPYVPTGTWAGEIHATGTPSVHDRNAIFELGDGRLVITYTVGGETWRATYAIGDRVTTESP